MKKWIASAGVLLSLLGTSGAQARPSILILLSSPADPYTQASEAFIRTLKEGGVGASIAQYDLRERHPAQIEAEIAIRPAALILAVGTPALKLAQKAARQVPVVFCMVLNAEIARDRNTAGVSMKIPFPVELAALRRVMPRARRLGVIYSPDSEALMEGFSEAAEASGFTLLKKRISVDKEFPEALNNMTWKIDAFVMVPDAQVYFPKSTEYLLQESLKQKMPVVGLSSLYTKAGALLSLDCDYTDAGRQSGELALKILGGARAGDLHLIPPRRFSLSLNLVTAERLGLSIPKDVVQEATLKWDK